MFLIKSRLCLVFLLAIINTKHTTSSNEDFCANKGVCDPDKTEQNWQIQKYKESSNLIFTQINDALNNYKPCNTTIDRCGCYLQVIEENLKPYAKSGISDRMIESIAKYGTSYKLYKGKLYREKDCMFPARCSGIEYFLKQIIPDLPDMDLIINTRDWPQLPKTWGIMGPIFSFSKTADYFDIMYPAWTFWAGGPAISFHPTGIGRWDLMREKLVKAASQYSWTQKLALGFFRGSRTSKERDPLILLSRAEPSLVDAQYTKNQAWKSLRDTLNATPADEVSFENHCKYKYLFNFRGVAASFRLKHLFLCKSLVFHVGEEWQEFFYIGLKPWVHYVPLPSNPTENDIRNILQFFRNNDSIARDIATRGFEFIYAHLQMEDVLCYWRKLLQSYAELVQYRVNPDINLIEIH